VIESDEIDGVMGLELELELDLKDNRGAGLMIA
jgi:hypothetical protein